MVVRESIGYQGRGDQIDRASARPGPNSRFMSLWYDGVCSSCGVKTLPGAKAWYDPDPKQVTCRACWSDATQLVVTSGDPVRFPVGGSSALKWSEDGHARNRKKAATGEYLMDRYLYRELQNGEVILSDRRVPNGKGNLDHIVVTSSGVWIIATKNWGGRIECKNTGGIRSDDERLFVGGKDRTDAVDDIYAHVIPVSSLLDDRSVPIHPALVLVSGNWGPRALRILLDRPYQHLGVWITWPRALSAKIKAQGPLGSETVERIGRQLSQHLIPM
jgi:Nuclease-related domain